MAKTGLEELGKVRLVCDKRQLKVVDDAIQHGIVGEESGDFPQSAWHGMKDTGFRAYLQL